MVRNNPLGLTFSDIFEYGPNFKIVLYNILILSFSVTHQWDGEKNILGTSNIIL